MGKIWAKYEHNYIRMLILAKYGHIMGHNMGKILAKYVHNMSKISISAQYGHIMGII